MGVSSELARRLLEAAPDPTVIVDRYGSIVYANSRVRDVLGYESGELVGCPVESLLPERFRAAHPAHREAFHSDPRPRPMGAKLELFALHKDGHAVPVEISLSPVHTEDGEMLVASAIRDVTEQKEIARQLVEANRAKSRFLAAASHDLRQPIQALTLLNRAAQSANSDEARGTIIEKQQRSLDSMARLLNALLDISKLEAGMVKPDIEDCAVREIFADLRAEFEEQSKAKGLDLVVEQCDDIVVSDRRLLTQILENLVANAIRYTQEGLVRLTCLHRNHSVQINVLDTGLGISPDEIDSIFEEFHQLDTGASRPEGLGLGLSIVKRTAELLGCSLNVTSAVGEGSTFSVTVPRGHGINVQHRREPAVLPEVGGGSILIVDDETAVVDATRMVLELEGFEVQTAASVQETSDCRLGPSVDLLITDYHLRGGETGMDVIRAVRQQTRPDLPVVLVSGDTSDRIAIQGSDDVSFLTKPVDVDELLTEIRHRISSS